MNIKENGEAVSLIKENKIIAIALYNASERL